MPSSKRVRARACLGGGVGNSRHVRSSASTNKEKGDTIDVEGLSEMKVVELKDRLRKLNLSVGGRKIELIQRLNDHYSNHQSSIDSGREDQNEEQYSHLVKNSPDTVRIEAEPQSTDLLLLTVPALKDRLRELGLPLGGRKADLIERLNAAMMDPEKTDEDATTHVPMVKELDDSNTSSMADNNGNSILFGILDEILDDMEGDEESVESDQANSLDSENAESFTIENASIRRARRKKYWKTQEVRELVKANDPRAVVKAEEMIATLEKIAEEEENEDYLPGSLQYTLLVESYAKSGTADAIRRAEDVIDCVLESDKVSLNAQMLNALIGAYANIGNPEAAEKATAILERMEYLKEFGGSVRPTVHSYSIAISAWTKCESEAAAVNAENILNRLFENYDRLLRNEEYGQHVEELMPNNIVFNSAIDAWARSGSPEAGEKSLALLHRMETLSRMADYNVRPDTISFNTCIKAFCNSDVVDAPIKAEEILSKLETNPQYPKRNGSVLIVRPNRLSYNTVINAWAKSSLPQSAMRAEDLLLRMIKSFKSDTFATTTPDSVTFASVLNALAKSKTVRFKSEKCHSILKAMTDLHEDDGSYDTKPNIICYNTVLNACAFSARGTEEERRQALKVAVETFNQMRQGKHDVSPDAVSYGNMLKCCANLMPPGDHRNGMASRLFMSCCDEGVVGGMCLDEIRRCIPPRAFLPLLADMGYDEPMRRHRKAHAVQLRDLPRKWTKNVKRTDMKSRQRGTFEKPKKKQERRIRRQKEKAPPVIRRPGLLVEYGASGKDL
eukprot:CAMPEP_0172544400 /NCGR_PEP_ID=MMETSP1067-20121228/14566_1 /TAXON_ID=265564 ORGANISM="Thalassiosira punctigera, Strain Tpunct2005C2" /NCGR_SAMPLE_ID=MMETSP1067 /ASSEMBLY_ACC=CAM_ASM_000444 /LENGTH=786 /DNA_ID=CAMNT_0013330959 /DNA_START=203 /DNA_END=2563 /DNA_ORIENTATION=-